MSALEQALVDYLQLRHSLGHQLAEAQWLLPDFVAYLDSRGLRTVTVQAALEWAQQSPSGRVTSVGPRRMTAVRGFARYLSGIDADTQLPPLGLMPHRQRWRQPFIYTGHRPPAERWPGRPSPAPGRPDPARPGRRVLRRAARPRGVGGDQLLDRFGRVATAHTVCLRGLPRPRASAFPSRVDPRAQTVDIPASV